MDLAEALTELYASDLEDFVATRTRLARAAREAGDRTAAAAISRLRKPTVSAWLLNQMVRESPSLVRELALLAEQLRAAQGRLDGDRLARLRPARDERLDEVVTAVEEVAAARGRVLASGVLDEVRSSLVSALASPSAQSAVTCGHLTRPVAYAGFGEVDLRGCVAIEAMLPGPADRPPAQEAEAAALRDAAARRLEEVREQARASAARHRRREEARQAVIDADRALTEATLAAMEADDAARKAQRRADELARLLTRAQAAATEAREEAARAQSDRDAASAALESTRDAFDAIPNADAAGPSA